MATGGGGSFLCSSEPFYDFSCSVCAKDDKHTEGESFCVECNEIFCNSCLVFHNKIAIMRQHEMLDQDKMVARKPQLHLVQLPTSRCTVHPGQVISMYCGQDDVVCCTMCIAEDHRTCEGVIYIPRKAINIKASREFQNINAAIDTMVSDIDKLKKDKKSDLDRITAQHQHIEASIQEIRDQMNKHLDDLQKKARDELERKFKIHEDQIKDALTKLEDNLSELKQTSAKLNNFKNESQLFVDMKTAKIDHTKTEIVYDDIENSVGKSGIHLVPNKQIINLLKQKSMGTVENTKQFNSVVHNGHFNISTYSDRQLCVINGMCQMLDSNTLITDYCNQKTKLLDTSYKVVDECLLPCQPWGVCRTGPNEVAIAMHNIKKVQFAEVTDKISLKGSFKVGDKCRGIAYNVGFLYVACGGAIHFNEGPGQVQVYDMSGKHLQSYVKDNNNKNLFSVPDTISVSDCRTKLHITDRDNGVVMMNLDGTGPLTFTHPDMKGPCGIGVVNNHELIVCGFFSNNVILFDKKGQQKAVLLKEKDGIKSPVSILYDKLNSRLIVSMFESKQIRVYNLL